MNKLGGIIGGIIITGAILYHGIAFAPAPIIITEQIPIETELNETYYNFLGSVKEAHYVRNELLYWAARQNRLHDYNYITHQAATIYLTSIEHDIHPYLLTALGIVESKLNHQSTSEVGAQGMFQIMPIIEAKYNLDAKVFEENVTAAAVFLRSLLNQYQGDLRLALAHYNGGSRPYYALANYPETQHHVAEVTRIYESMLEHY